MDAYHIALGAQADCIEIDVSRSSDGVLFALHDRYTFALLHGKGFTVFSFNYVLLLFMLFLYDISNFSTLRP